MPFTDQLLVHDLEHNKGRVRTGSEKKNSQMTSMED